MMELSKRPALIGFLIFLAAAAYYASFARYGLNLWDEGDIYVGGMRTLHGQHVYKDFYGYPPGGYWMVEAMFRLFGFGMMPVRYLYATTTALFGVLAFHIGRRIMPWPFVAVAVALVLSAPSVYYQRFYGLMFLLNAWAAFVSIENRRHWPWLVAAAVTTYFFKGEVLLVAAPMYGWFVLRMFGSGKKGWLALAALAAAAVALFDSAIMRDILSRLMTEYQRWGNPFPVLWESYQGREFGFFGFMENILFYLPFGTAAALALLAWRERKPQLAVLAFLQAGALGVVVYRAGFDNLIRCLPLFFIAASYLAFRLVGSVPEKRRVSAAVAMAAVGAVYLADLNFQNGFYVGSIGAVREFDTAITRGRAAGVVASAGDAAMVERGTDWIDMAVKKDDPIFAVPLNPIWYYLSGRENPTRYDWVLPGMFVRPGAEDALVARLDAVRPPLIIIVDIPIDNREERRLAVYAPKLVNWIVAGYRYSGMVGYFQMWSRK